MTQLKARQGFAKEPSMKILCVGDTHFPWVNHNALAKVVAWARAERPTHIVQIGDLYDYYLFSKYTTNVNALTPQQELRRGRRMAEVMWDALKAASPTAKRYQMQGNHSFSDETDLLTRQGWKNVKEITKDDYVAQFDIKTGAVGYAFPEVVESHYEDYVYEFEGRYTKQAVSWGHDVVVGQEKIQAMHLASKKSPILEYKIRTSATPLAKAHPTWGQEENLDWFRLITWVVMDGYIVNLTKYDPKTTKARVQFKLSKARKIKSLRSLLDKLGVKYTFHKCKKSGINKLQPYYIRIYGAVAQQIVSYLKGRKEFPLDWVTYPKEALDAVAGVIQETDGAKSFSHTTWVSTHKHNVDVIQACAILNGCDFAYKVMPPSASGFKNGRPQYHCKFSYGATLAYSKPLSVGLKPYKRNVYCVTMPKGTVVSRIDGKVAFTGNCARLMKRVQEKLPGILASVKIAGKYKYLLNLDDLFKFDGVESTLDYTAEKPLCGALFLHGWKGNLGEHAKYYGKNVVCGHTHRGGSYFESAAHKTLWELNCGFLGNKSALCFKYGDTKTKMWTVGFGVVDSLGPRFIPL